jgi:hypothetical protein
LRAPQAYWWARMVASRPARCARRRPAAQRLALAPTRQKLPSAGSACTWCASCPTPQVKPASGSRCAAATARLRQSGNYPGPDRLSSLLGSSGATRAHCASVNNYSMLKHSSYC